MPRERGGGTRGTKILVASRSSRTRRCKSCSGRSRVARTRERESREKRVKYFLMENKAQLVPEQARRLCQVIRARRVRRPAARTVPEVRVSGCGNGAPVEITNRFPQELGNLAPCRRRDSHIPTADRLCFLVHEGHGVPREGSARVCGCGKGAPVEITNRFPQELGNLGPCRRRDSHIPTGDRLVFLCRGQRVGHPRDAWLFLRLWLCGSRGMYSDNSPGWPRRWAGGDTRRRRLMMPQEESACVSPVHSAK